MYQIHYQTCHHQISDNSWTISSFVISMSQEDMIFICLWDYVAKWLRSASGLLIGVHSSNRHVHWRHYFKSRSDLRLFWNRRPFQILDLWPIYCYQIDVFFRAKICMCFYLVTWWMWVKFVHHLHCILYQMNAKRHCSRHKFSAPDPRFVYKRADQRHRKSKIQNCFRLSVIFLVVFSNYINQLIFWHWTSIWGSERFEYLDWVAQTLFKLKCQLRLNWDLNLPEMYIELIYT